MQYKENMAEHCLHFGCEPFEKSIYLSFKSSTKQFVVMLQIIKYEVKRFFFFKF